MARLSRLLFLVAQGFGLGLGACNNSTATIVGVTPSTAIAVDPLEFLGNVKCGAEVGDMQLYVATLKDASPFTAFDRRIDVDGGALQMPSSAPTGCGISVLFENILVGREYEAAVDGYDRSDIVPLAPGSRVMVETGTGRYVKPRWTTRCGHFRFPPALRSVDGGLKSDAGNVEYADSGMQTNGGYLDCSPVPLYGPRDTPWLGGPVCANTQQTITVRGCEPLSE